MSDDEHSEVLPDTSTINDRKCEIVSRADFDIELRRYFNAQSDKTKKPEWTSTRIKQVINLVEEYKSRKMLNQKTTNQQYHHATKYDVLDVGKEKILILKRKTLSSPVTQIIPSENYYNILMNTHVATGHGGRDKIIHALKEKFMVPQFAIKIFISLCKTCMTKKSFPKSGIVVRPLITNDFNRRGQMDLIDLQSAPDEDFKWLLNYQDHLTKFCFLRPLKSKRASQVAVELLKIFLEVGCPHILQSDNGREFTANVIKELMSLWPTCKILNGRPRYPQSQGSVERCNQDVENMMRAWMQDNKSTNWSVGCYFVQFQKNTSLHRTIARTPYKALFGHEPITGLAFTHLPKNIIDKLENEEDLEKVLRKDKENIENDDDFEKENNTTKAQQNVKDNSDSTLSINQKENNKNADPDIFLEQQYVPGQIMPAVENKRDSGKENNDNKKYAQKNQLIKVATENKAQTLLNDHANSIIILEDNTLTPYSLNIVKVEELPIVIADKIYSEMGTVPNAVSPNEGHKFINMLDSSLDNNSKLICHICNKETTGAHTCNNCKKLVHVICSTTINGDESYGLSGGSHSLCNLCSREEAIHKERTQSYINLKSAAEKMVMKSSKKFKDIEVNTTVLVEVPKVDRGPLDSKNLVGRVIEKRNGLYRVGTSAGVIKDWLPRNAIQSTSGAKLNDEIPDVTLPIRSILSESSQFGGQGFKMCNCSSSAIKCRSNRCACKKNNVLCNSKCHKSSHCENK